MTCYTNPRWDIYICVLPHAVLLLFSFSLLPLVLCRVACPLLVTLATRPMLWRAAPHDPALFLRHQTSQRGAAIMAIDKPCARIRWEGEDGATLDGVSRDLGHRLPELSRKLELFIALLHLHSSLPPSSYPEVALSRPLGTLQTQG